MRVARQHQEAFAEYVLRQRYDGEILYFLCAETTDLTTAARRRLWARYATGGMREVMVPGAHGGFHHEPQCSAVVAALRAALVPRVVRCSRPV